MNIEKIFEIVETDEMNLPLQLIIWELEMQGYAVSIEGLNIASKDTETNWFEDFQKACNEFNIQIIKENLCQKFKIVFSDYHKFNFQPC